jgi:hypothetical protein
MAKLDPLENAKVVDPRNKVHVAPSESPSASAEGGSALSGNGDGDEGAVSASETPSAGAPRISEKGSARAAKRAAEVAVLAPAPRQYKVLKDKVISRNGSITTLRSGSTISELGYGGAEGVQRLVDAGVDLEEI